MSRRGNVMQLTALALAVLLLAGCRHAGPLRAAAESGADPRVAARLTLLSWVRGEYGQTHSGYNLFRQDLMEDEIGANDLAYLASDEAGNRALWRALQDQQIATAGQVNEAIALADKLSKSRNAWQTHATSGEHDGVQAIYIGSALAVAALVAIAISGGDVSKLLPSGGSHSNQHESAPTSTMPSRLAHHSSLASPGTGGGDLIAEPPTISEMQVVIDGQVYTITDPTADAMRQARANINEIVRKSDQRFAAEQAARQQQAKQQAEQQAERKREMARAQAEQRERDERQRREEQQRREREQAEERKRRAEEAFQACMSSMAPETIPERGDGFGPVTGALKSARAAAESCSGRWRDCVGNVRAGLGNLPMWGRQVDQQGNRRIKLPSGPWSLGLPKCSADGEAVRQVSFWCWETGGTRENCLNQLNQAISSAECAAQLSHLLDRAEAEAQYADYRREHEAKCRALRTE